MYDWTMWDLQVHNCVHVAIVYTFTYMSHPYRFMCAMSLLHCMCLIVQSLCLWLILLSLTVTGHAICLVMYLCLCFYVNSDQESPL